MMFENPIVGGLVLIREAIRSPDYVAGVSGWSINRDGSVEFADGTFRGFLDIGNLVYRVRIGNDFGRVQFTDGAGDEQGFVVDVSTATRNRLLVGAGQRPYIPGTSPAAAVDLRGEDDTNNIGPELILVTVNPAGRPGERIYLQSAAIDLLSAGATSITATVLNVLGALAATGAISGPSLTVTGAVAGASVGATGNVTAGGNVVAVGSVAASMNVTAANNVTAEKNPAGNNWDDAHLIGSNPTAGVAAVSIRTAPFAAQMRLGSTINDVYWRDASDSAYIGHQAAAYTVASREATKAGIRTFAVDAIDRVRRLVPIQYRRRHTGPEVPAADRLHLLHPELRKLGPTGAVAAVDAVHDSSVEHLGFTVENVADAVPEAVVMGDDGRPAAYDLAAMVATLAAAVQQLADRIEHLEAAGR